jgi:hypothetical protein
MHHYLILFIFMNYYTVYMNKKKYLKKCIDPYHSLINVPVITELVTIYPIVLFSL